MKHKSELQEHPVQRHPHLEATWPSTPLMASPRLVLTWGAHEMEVTEKRPVLTVGRGEFSGIVIRDDKVSRLHARIEFCGLGFVLTDQSSNGTYVCGTDGVTHLVRNQTHLLAGSGTLSFGIDPATGRPHLVRYAVRP